MTQSLGACTHHTWNCELAFGTRCNMDMMLHCMQVSVPVDETTYWCKAFVYPEEVLEQTHYITKVTI